jgi:undecaprenyl-phosphate galactose phosphotransferase
MRYRNSGPSAAKGLKAVILIFTDIVSIYISLYLAYLSRKYIYIYFFPNRPDFLHTYYYYVKLFWIPLAYLFLTTYHGLYTRTRTYWEDAREYLKSYIIAFILILTVAALYKREGQYISRLVMVTFLLNSIWINLVLRFLIVQGLHSQKAFLIRTLIIGAGKTGKSLLVALRRERYLGYEVVGFVDDDPGKKDRFMDGVKVLGSTEDIIELNKQYYLQKVFIAIPSLSATKLTELYASLHEYFKEVVIIPQIKGMSLINSEVYHLFNSDLPLLSVKNNLNFTSNIILKEIFDYLLVFFTLPFFLVLLVLFALAIKFESKGPVFYRHTRYAMSGKEIKVYKFRSMYRDADARLEQLMKKNEELRKEWQNNFKLKDDPRVTGIGRFLRKISLDELPQIFNIIKGDMSFIGPRPVIKRELDRYYKRYTEYFYKVKPGITGLWQVSGRSDTKYDFRVRTDLWYVLNWSLWLDVVILFKTFGAVIRGSGAY